MASDFVQKRNAALFSMDRPTIEAYYASIGQPMDHLSDQTFWASVCKAVCNIKDAPESVVKIARRWLRQNGMSEQIKWPYYYAKKVN